MIGGNPHRILYFWHSTSNKLLVLLSKMMTHLNNTNKETSNKKCKREIINSLDLKNKRFGFKPEVITTVVKIEQVPIYEVGISYHCTKFEEVAMPILKLPPQDWTKRWL